MMAGLPVLSDLEVCLKCVDANEVIYDDNERYLKRISSSSLDCKEEYFREILTNLQTCQEVCLNFLKQVVIIKEPRVRFKPQNDVSSLQKKIEETHLSPEAKTCLRDVSKVGYNLLKKTGLINNLVEFDSERHATVDLFGKKVEKVVGSMDILSLTDTKTAENLSTEDKTRDKEKKSEVKESKFLQESEDSAADKRKHAQTEVAAKKDFNVTKSASTGKYQSKEKIFSKLKRQNKVQESRDTLKRRGNKTEVQESMDRLNAFENTTEIKEESENILNVCEITTEFNPEQENFERVIITFILTPRISVNAVHIFKKLLYLYMLPGSYFYLLVCHIGPLNEEQEMVLYQFVPDEKLIDICKEYGTKCLDLQKLEEVFRTVHGRKLQKLADLKDYFKYYIYDCPGVKDHAKDNRDRLERYLRKKAVKKERKKKNKQNKEESETKSESTQPCSSLSEVVTKVNDISDSQIMSAADLQNCMPVLR